MFGYLMVFLMSFMIIWVRLHTRMYKDCLHDPALPKGMEGPGKRDNFDVLK
jgi:hypothetical protein